MGVMLRNWFVANFFGSRKDEMSGEVPVAFIVQAPGFNLSEEDVKAFIAKQVDFMF
jgi:acyl-CoA synthetase (AMP-forming)/AMP-acid ligase II